MKIKEPEISAVLVECADRLIFCATVEFKGTRYIISWDNPAEAEEYLTANARYVINPKVN
jgi:hypothetical protein